MEKRENNYRVEKKVPTGESSPPLFLRSKQPFFVYLILYSVIPGFQFIFTFRPSFPGFLHLLVLLFLFLLKLKKKKKKKKEEEEMMMMTRKKKKKKK